MQNLVLVLVMLLSFAGGLLGHSGGALAQGLQISPILVQFMPGQMTTTILVTDKGADAASLQLRPFKWDQIDGKDRLAPTGDLSVSPPITAIAAGAAQTFRLVLRRPAASTEASYRLLLDQLPSATAPGTIRVVLRLSIPVFAEPERRLERSLSWRVVVDAGGGTLIGMNRGGGHVRILNPVLTQGRGVRLPMQTGESPYILPGSERSWRITSGSLPPAGSTLHLAAMSDGGPIDAAVQVSGP